MMLLSNFKDKENNSSKYLIGGTGAISGIAGGIAHQQGKKSSKLYDEADKLYTKKEILQKGVGSNDQARKYVRENLSKAKELGLDFDLKGKNTLEAMNKVKTNRVHKIKDIDKLMGKVSEAASKSRKTSYRAGLLALTGTSLGVGMLANHLANRKPRSDKGKKRGRYRTK